MQLGLHPLFRNIWKIPPPLAAVNEETYSIQLYEGIKLSLIINYPSYTRYFDLTSQKFTTLLSMQNHQKLNR